MDSTWMAVIITLGLMALFGLLGLIESLESRRAWQNREAFERTRTTGTIVGFAEERRRYRNGRSPIAHYYTVCYPIVRFQVDGTEYKLKSTRIVPRDKCHEGQAVDLLYDSNNPTHFHLDQGDMEERSTWGAIVFALAWLTCALAAIALILYFNPQLGIQLKRALYNATAPLRSGMNPENPRP